MQKRYYIAYGSNLNIRQMKFRCPTARIIGTATLPDYELLFKGSKTGSYLTVEPKKGKNVPVAVWETTETDEAALDRYEGFPTFYYKAEMELPIIGIRTGKVGKERSICTSCTSTDHLVFQACIILRPALKGTEHLNLMRTFCFRQ